MHGKKDQTSRRIADVSGDVAKSKQFLPFLQRAGRMQAVVEFIASASRYRYFSIHASVKYFTYHKYYVMVYSLN